MIKNENLTSKFFNEGTFLFSQKKTSLTAQNKKQVVKFFKKSGCIVFRNFNFTAQNYKKFTDLFSKSYANDTSDMQRRKKTKHSKFVRHVDAGYKKMSLHSEASFSPSWPEIVWFFCNIPSKKNGETTLCDGIKLWQALSKSTKNYFLSNPLKYELKIPVLKGKKSGKRKKWIINKPGAHNAIMDYKTGNLYINQVRCAANKGRFLNKLSFTNHVLHQKPYIDKTIVKWGTVFNKKIPKSILKEVEKKAENLTYYHQWKRFDLIMLDNRRFMHARNFFSKKDRRQILNTQTLESNFN